MKLMVIDGNSMINRSFYGIRPLSTRDGLYTHAVFGFLTTLTRLREEEKPDAVCVTFDVHAPTFRHTADESYKATRKPMPEELRMQMPVLKEVLDALHAHGGKHLPALFAGIGDIASHSGSFLSVWCAPGRRSVPSPQGRSDHCWIKAS